MAEEGELVVKKRDRWADSDSESDDDGDRKGKKKTKKDGKSDKGSGQIKEEEQDKQDDETASAVAGEGGELGEGGAVAGSGGLRTDVEELKSAFGKGGIGGDANGAGQLALMTPPRVEDSAVEDRYNPLLHGCRSVDQYERINFIDEGAYGAVYCARNRTTGEVVALKQVKMAAEQQKEGFPITALRETNVLLSLHHPNIVGVKEMVIGSSLDKVYMVMEYYDHDLKCVMESMAKKHEKWSISEVKNLMRQLLRAVEYMHRHWYIHRDLKTSNLLYNSKGRLAICDFGLARRYEEPIRAYTFMVVTLWYRPPELLLGQRLYSTPVDMWGLGCIFAELLLMEPMFMGKTEVEQLSKIFSVLGVPTEERWPGWSKLPQAGTIKWKAGMTNKLREKFPATSFASGTVLSDSGFDLLNGLLALNPDKRLSAEEALKHPWFTEVPLPKEDAYMPVFPGRNDKHIQKKMVAAASPPPG